MSLCARIAVFLLLPPAVFAEIDPFERAIPVPEAEFDFERGDDLDFDGQPDDWARRKGKGFPQYVRMEIDPQVGFDGTQSLRIDIDGGKAAYYSPPASISPHHSYLFSGRVRTLGLNHDAAVLSLSFLDARMERVQRVLSAPVSGSFDGWTEVRIGPVMPTSDVRYVVIGCHLVHGEEMDYRGSVWFDAFSLRMLPRLSLRTNFASQFRAGEVPLDVESVVSGLDDEGHYELRMFLENADFVRQDGVTYQLDASEEVSVDDGPAAPIVREWTLPPQQNGFYRLYAHLIRDGEIVLEESTSLAVLDHSDVIDSENPPAFGWSVETWPSSADSERLLAVASEAGIGWIKLPLWNTVHEGDIEGIRSSQVAELLQEMKRRGIRTVGLLREPPREIRRKFADDWSGVSELFTMSPSFWMPSIEPVMARYSSLVHHWQLGNEMDTSFVGVPRLPTLLADLKMQFDRLGRDTMLGTHWRWGRAIPKRSGLDRPFLSLSSLPPLDEKELVSVLEKSKDSGFARWVLLRPRTATLSSDRSTRRSDLEQRVAELLRRVTAARIGDADVVYAADVFHPRIGLLNEDASPSELFLPWRTWSLALDRAEYLGSFRLPNGSTNHVFAKGEEAIVCLWNDEPTDERLTLGREMRMVNLWGQSSALIEKDRRKVVPVGRVPVLLRGGSARLARFRLSTRFDKGKMPSSTDEFADELILTNPFPQGISGECQIRAPREWEVRPRTVQFGLTVGETKRVPVLFRVPSHQSLGPEPLDLEFQLDAESVYHFTVGRDYTIGLGDVKIDVSTEVLPDGMLEVRQKIQNNTEETLSFRVSLYVPGQKRRKRRVPNLGPNESNTITYPVPDAASLSGQRLRIRAEQEGGNRVLNKSWVLE